MSNRDQHTQTRPLLQSRENSMLVSSDAGSVVLEPQRCMPLRAIGAAAGLLYTAAVTYNTELLNYVVLNM